MKNMWPFMTPPKPTVSSIITRFTMVVGIIRKNAVAAPSMWLRYPHRWTVAHMLTSMLKRTESMAVSAISRSEVETWEVTVGVIGDRLGSRF